MLFDPMCGSGTFLIEGCLMAFDIAPELLRQRRSLGAWLGHIPRSWEKLLDEAYERKQQGLNKARLFYFLGTDNQQKVLSIAKGNATKAGVNQYINFIRVELGNLNDYFEKHASIKVTSGLIITNPPYGKRLNLNETQLLDLYRNIGTLIRNYFSFFHGGLITDTPAYCRRMGIRSHKQITVFNGAIECKLLLFKPHNQQIEEKDLTKNIESAQKNSTPKQLTNYDLPSKDIVAFSNRVQKNIKILSKWAKKNNIECYRIYDADLPQYAVAIDKYKNYLIVQEYQAPKQIVRTKAEDRLHDILIVLAQILPIPKENIIVKKRHRQNEKQYEKQEYQGDRLYVHEHNYQFVVDLHSYIDTGLFLDHRPLRKIIEKQAKDKNFLNLFCYTATASIYAIKGGARSAVNVDISQTYLNWAKNNFTLNNISKDKYELIQQDCFTWLNEQVRLLQRKTTAKAKKYDLIYLDPPTFSNSKRMLNTLDIQKDHKEIIDLCMQLLTMDGILYFSNHLKTFKLNQELLDSYKVTDITSQTIDKDFIRHITKNIGTLHHCWKIQHIK